jgi:hypothetical protein
MELAIEMGEWTDAHKTSNNIYQLMSRVNKKQTDQEIKTLYIEFFGHLAKIFWESKLYMFHTYAMYNVYYLTKSIKDASAETKFKNNERLVLAALSIPLNGKMSNFERLPFTFLPECFRTSDETPSAREDLLATARIL